MFASIIFLSVVLCFEVGPLGSQARNVQHYGSGFEEVHDRYTRQISPGTKWCGNGDRASHDDHLGYFAKTDACCREHDKCPSSIAARETKHGLTNPDKSTRSHCSCDKKFYDCLKKASTSMSRTVRRIYFNFLRKKCFHEKECPAGKTCEVEYQWGDGRSYLPKESELPDVYNSLAVLDSEWEYDPFEDEMID